MEPQVNPEGSTCDSAANELCPPRLASLAIAFLFGFAGAIFAWPLLLVFGFSTMIDARTPSREWWRLYADRVLFGDGWLQLIVVIVLLFLTGFGAAAFFLQLSCALFRRPCLRMAMIASCMASLVATLAIISVLLVLRT